MVKVVIERDQMTNPKFQRAASEGKKLVNKACVPILNRLTSVHPLEGSPKQIVLGGAPPILFLLDIPNLICDLPCGEL